MARISDKEMNAKLAKIEKKKKMNIPII